MREIKFRAWAELGKTMIYSGNCEENGDNFWNVTYKLPKMQFTGLLDKNGEEIYEGDIVKYECGCSDGSVYKKIASVKYGEFNCSCCDGVYGWYFDDGDIREAKRYEVIGNIYENPELLTNLN